MLLWAALAAAVALVVGPLAFPHYTGNGDEPVYVLQAEALAAGDLTLDAEHHNGPFRPWLTGVHDGRVYTQYQPGWPSVLAVADRLGAMRLGLAGAAAGLVLAAGLVAEQVFGHRRTTRAAAAMTAATPLFVVHSFTWLSYTFSAAWLLGGAGVAIGAVRGRSRPLAALAGGVLAAGLLIRPFDAVLVSAVLGAALLIHGRGPRAAACRHLALPALAGAVIPVVATLAYNQTVTGAPLRFPLRASAPDNRFGFGPREILPGEPALDYSFAQAVDALEANVAAIPSWTVLGGLSVLAAGLALASRTMDRRVRLSLALGIVAFPLGYLFWWATALSGPGARNGLGPHYYLPSIALLTIVAARGVVLFVERARGDPRVTVVRLAAVGLALMAYNGIDKVSDIRFTSDAQARSGDLAMPGEPAIVLLPEEQGYVLADHPVLANAPDPAAADLVFAVDDGFLNTEARMTHEWQVHRLANVWHPGDGLFSPTLELVPITYTSAPALCVTRPDDAPGRLIWGWNPAFHIDISHEAIEIEAGDSGVLQLVFIPDDAAAEWARVELPFGMSEEPDLVELELPSLIERGARFPARTAWLNSRDLALLPVAITPGRCP